MPTTIAAAGTNLVNATRLLAERGPELAELHRHIDEYEHRLQDDAQLLAMPREQRLQHCGRPLFEACQRQEMARHEELSYVVATGAMGIGSTATVTAAQISPVLGLVVGIGALAAGLALVPRIYMAAVKHWFVPKSMDPLVIEGLERERKELTAALAQAKEREAVLQKEVEATAAASDAAPTSSIAVDPAFVVINGMKVPIRR